MRSFLALVIAICTLSCAAAQKPPADRRAGTCFVQETEALTKLSNASLGFSIDLPEGGWKIECGDEQRAFFAYSRALGLHVTGEVLAKDQAMNPQKLLRAIYAIGRDKAKSAGTRVGEADFESGPSGPTLRYEVFLDNPDVPDADRTNIRSIHEFKPLKTSTGKLVLLHVSWTGSNQTHAALRDEISMPIKTFAPWQ